MLTYMLHILIKKGFQDKVIDTLSAIEHLTQADAVIVDFAWLQHEQDPYRFTLFEQRESQEHLNYHLKKNPLLWSSFEPCLPEEPRSENFCSMSALVGPPAADQLRNFVRKHFSTRSDRETSHTHPNEATRIIRQSCLPLRGEPGEVPRCSFR
jgi:quinol monooxygenase YgiN